MGARHGIVFIDPTAAYIGTIGFSPREIGREWLTYLAGRPSMFDEWCRFKERRTSNRQPSSEWKRTRLRIFQRDRFVCTYCGAADRPLHCDHVLPVVLGGSSDDDNLTTACNVCNSAKGAKRADEFRRRDT